MCALGVNTLYLMRSTLTVNNNYLHFLYSNIFKNLFLLLLLVIYDRLEPVLSHAEKSTNIRLKIKKIINFVSQGLRPLRTNKTGFNHRWNVQFSISVNNFRIWLKFIVLVIIFEVQQLYNVIPKYVLIKSCIFLSVLASLINESLEIRKSFVYNNLIVSINCFLIDFLVLYFKTL